MKSCFGSVWMHMADPVRWWCTVILGWRRSCGDSPQTECDLNLCEWEWRREERPACSDRETHTHRELVPVSIWSNAAYFGETHSGERMVARAAELHSSPALFTGLGWKWAPSGQTKPNQTTIELLDLHCTCCICRAYSAGSIVDHFTEINLQIVKYSQEFQIHTEFYFYTLFSRVGSVENRSERITSNVPVWTRTWDVAMHHGQWRNPTWPQGQPNESLKVLKPGLVILGNLAREGHTCGATETSQLLSSASWEGLCQSFRPKTLERTMSDNQKSTFQWLALWPLSIVSAPVVHVSPAVDSGHVQWEHADQLSDQMKWLVVFRATDIWLFPSLSDDCIHWCQDLNK